MNRREDLSREIDVLDPEVADWHDDPWDDYDEIGMVEPLRRQTRLAKWGAYSLLCLGLAAILVVGAAGWWYMNRINPEGEVGDPVRFNVRADDTVETGSMRLEDREIVDDAGMFRFYVERQGGLELTPGYYEIRPGDHLGNVMERLSIPPSQTFTQVTFPEGFTVEQIARRLAADAPRMRVDRFHEAAADTADLDVPYRPEGVNSLEGLLFPDTYQVSNSDSEGLVINELIDQMERVTRQEELETKAAELGITPYQALIVASIIEREVAVPEERPMVARVIYNRLARGEPLQIDATVLYGQEVADLDRNLEFSELRGIDTPYNTYMHGGLPPTPIANPGRDAIRAALNPATDPPQGDPICRWLRERQLPDDCTYLFYVLSPEGDGSHVFAAHPEQHQENVDAAAEAGVLP